MQRVIAGIMLAVTLLTTPGGQKPTGAKPGTIATALEAMESAWEPYDEQETMATWTAEEATYSVGSSEGQYLGLCCVTAYCACEACCGKSDGITATGTHATQGRTVAVDPSVIPYGSTVYIDGVPYIAEDCGGAIGGTRIDLFFDSHQDAINWGVRYCEVWVQA